MKSLLVMIVALVCTGSAQAGIFRDDLNGPEALALFHKSLVELKNDTQAMVARGLVEVPKIKRGGSAAGRACVQSGSPKACEAAIREFSAYSVVPVRDRAIFQLDHDLKTKYRFDVTTGMRVFQLSTALRWLARADVYNGVPMPKSFNRGSYKAFLGAVEGFLVQKNIDVKKAAPMIGTNKIRK